jgi:hypothetical protein
MAANMEKSLLFACMQAPAKHRLGNFISCTITE